MHHLLKSAIFFELMARGAEEQKPSKIKQTKEDKKQQIRDALTLINMRSSFVKIKEYYNIIKQDTQLFHDVATNIAQSIRAGYDFRKEINTSKYSELHNKIFEIFLQSPDDLGKAVKILEWWGASISPDLIRQFTHKILARVKEERDIEDQPHLFEPLEFIRSLISNPKIKPYLNTTLFEKVLSYNDPSRLPVFEPHAQRFNTTDIMKMLFSRDRIHSNFEMRMADLLDIISKSTPQAQELLRNILWQEYSWGALDTRKFMLDEANKPMGLNLQPLDIHGKVAPASDVSFNEYSDKQQAEREKWRQVFTDFKKVPVVPF